MSSTYPVVRASAPTAAWLVAHPLRDPARSRVSAPGMALPDALLADPRRVVDLLKEALIQAIEQDAPVAVVDELLLSVRVLSLGLASFDPADYAVGRLAALRGLRDGDEIGRSLREGADGAPDQRSRDTILRWSALADASPAAGEAMILGIDDVASPGRLVDPGGAVDGAAPDGGTTAGGTGVVDVTDGALAQGPAPAPVDAGAELGAIIGAIIGGPDAASEGAALGSQLGGGAAGFDVGTASQIGAQIGGSLGGPAGASVGAQVGAQVGGQAGSGSAAASLLVHAGAAAACAACGGVFCLPCMLAAEGVGGWVIEQVSHWIDGL